jgi:hypothetical protein
VTAPAVASSKTWQVSVPGWAGGGEGWMVGGVMVVGLVVVGVVGVVEVVDGKAVGGRC